MQNIDNAIYGYMPYPSSSPYHLFPQHLPATVYGLIPNVSHQIKPYNELLVPNAFDDVLIKQQFGANERRIRPQEDGSNDENIELVQIETTAQRHPYNQTEEARSTGSSALSSHDDISPRSLSDMSNEMNARRNNRAAHNIIEKTRRAILRSSLDELNKVIPNDEDNSKDTTLQLLSRACDYVSGIKRRKAEASENCLELKKKRVRLLEEIGRMQLQIATLKEQDQQASDPVSSSKTACSTSLERNIELQTTSTSTTISVPRIVGQISSDAISNTEFECIMKAVPRSQVLGATINTDNAATLEYTCETVNESETAVTKTPPHRVSRSHMKCTSNAANMLENINTVPLNINSDEFNQHCPQSAFIYSTVANVQSNQMFPVSFPPIVSSEQLQPINSINSYLSSQQGLQPAFSLTYPRMSSYPFYKV